MTCHQAKAMKNGNELSFRFKHETEILFSLLVKAAFPKNMDVSALSLLSESFDKYSPFLGFLTSLFRDGVFLCFTPQYFSLCVFAFQ